MGKFKGGEVWVGFSLFFLPRNCFLSGVGKVKVSFLGWECVFFHIKGFFSKGVKRELH